MDGGNGKTSPFGDGRGGDGAKAMGDNDFTKNPAGGGKGPKPRSLMEMANNEPQKPVKDDTISADEIPAGGKDLKADPPDDSGNPIGTRPTGNRLPFKLDGGG